MKVKNIGNYPINLISGQYVEIGEEKEVELSEDEHRVFVVQDKVLKAVEQNVEKTKKKTKEMI